MQYNNINNGSETVLQHAGCRCARYSRHSSAREACAPAVCPGYVPCIGNMAMIDG